MEKVFVYGTLRKPQGGKSPALTANHRVVEPYLIEVNEGALLERAAMIDLGPFPAIIHGVGTIKGDLLTIKDEGLPRIDRVEGHPHFYHRVRVNVAVMKDDGLHIVEAWTYWGPGRYELDRDNKVIRSGDWLNQV